MTASGHSLMHKGKQWVESHIANSYCGKTTSTFLTVCELQPRGRRKRKGEIRKRQGRFLRALVNFHVEEWLAVIKQQTSIKVATHIPINQAFLSASCQKVLGQHKSPL